MLRLRRGQRRRTETLLRVPASGIVSPMQGSSKEAAPRGRAAYSSSHSTVYQHPILKHHKVMRCAARSPGSLATHSPCTVALQGLPVREMLQLQFKIVRDKSIKEALLFGLYFSVFLLIAFQVPSACGITACLPITLPSGLFLSRARRARVAACRRLLCVPIRQ